MRALTQVEIESVSGGEEKPKIVAIDPYGGGGAGRMEEVVVTAPRIGGGGGGPVGPPTPVGTTEYESAREQCTKDALAAAGGAAASVGVALSRVAPPVAAPVVYGSMAAAAIYTGVSAKAQCNNLVNAAFHIQ